MIFSRRNMLKTFVGAAAMVVAGGNTFTLAADAAKTNIPVALQLYSIREVCKKDLPGTLKKVAAMGYEGVEFAGYHGYSAPELKKMLDENGLKCCGTHIQRPDLTGDNLQKTIDFNKTLGNRFLIVSWMSPDYLKSPESIKETAAFFNETAKKAAAQGMLIGYHAHGGDFIKVGGTDATGWDMLFENLDPAVVMQLDVGNCQGGGGDPIAVLKKFPGRSKTIHLKEDGGKAEAAIGEGEVDWPAVFELCQKEGTEWMIVESEFTPDSLDLVERCIQNIRKMTDKK